MNRVKKKSFILLVPIILAMGFIPMLVHEYNYNTHLSVFDWFPNTSETQVDFFLAYKSFAIMAVGAIMILIIMYQYIHKEKLSFDSAFYFLFAYAALVLMSGILSPYRAYAFRGGYEMFAPVWVVLSYVIFCYYTYHNIQTEEQIYRIFHWSGIGILLISIIGIFQFFKLDFFKSNIGKMLITNPARWNNLDKLSFTFEEGAVYTTLYNIDYLSFYYGLLIPITIALIIAADKLWKRILYSLICILFIICLIGSSASTGPIALGLTAIVALYLLLSRNKLAFRIGIAIGSVLLVIGILVLCFTPFGHSVSAKLFGTTYYDDNYTLSTIETNDDNVTIVNYGKTLVISYDIDFQADQLNIEINDENGNPVPNIPSGTGTYYLDDSYLENSRIQFVSFEENVYGIKVFLRGRQLYFTKIQDRGYYYLNPANKFVKVNKIPVAHIVYDDFISDRGKIINRTAPLLKRYLLLGIGANNFALVYPHDDYLLPLNTHIQWGTTYDVKAHNWYLQEWIENGLPAMLCLICFYLIYAINSIHIYHTIDLHKPLAIIGLGIFLGTLTYMFAALANDSNVNTAPVFWILLGVGYAVNRINKAYIK